MKLRVTQGGKLIGTLQQLSENLWLVSNRTDFRSEYNMPEEVVSFVRDAHSLGSTTIVIDNEGDRWLVGPANINPLGELPPQLESLLNEMKET